MFFLCIHCDNPAPLVATVIEYKDEGSAESQSGSHVTRFFICPNCKEKFVVKIEDQGKVR